MTFFLAAGIIDYIFNEKNFVAVPKMGVEQQSWKFNTDLAFNKYMYLATIVQAKNMSFHI